MEPKEYMEDQAEHATKEWMKIRIQYDQAQSAIGVLQGENSRIGNKFERNARQLKDFTVNHDNVVKEYTRQINEANHKNEDKSGLIDDLHQKIKKNEQIHKEKTEALLEKQRLEVFELKGQISDLYSQNHGLEEFGR